MKKLFKITLSLILTVFGFLPIQSAYATGATLSLSPASGTFNTGCNYLISVHLDTGGVDTDGTDAILFYDATRFRVNQIKSGTTYPDYPGNSIDPQNGKITISGLASVASPFKGVGNLALIDLTVQSTAPPGATQLNFDFDPNNKSKTTDSNVVQRGQVVDVLNQVTNGNYVIGTGTCDGKQAIATGSAGKGGYDYVTPTVPVKTLPSSGDSNTTLLLGILGGALTVLGVIGIAIL